MTLDDKASPTSHGEIREKETEHDTMRELSQSHLTILRRFVTATFNIFGKSFSH
jgi:hypothetical protein